LTTCAGIVAAFRRRFALDGRGLVAVVVASIASGVALVGFGQLADNVSDHDGLVSGDPGRLAFFVDHRTPGIVEAARGITSLGSFQVLVGVAVLAGVVLWWRRAQLGLALAPLASLALAAGLTSAVKYMVNRPRPPVYLRLVTENEPSFPSGHATDSTALYLALGVAAAIVLFRRPLTRALGIAVGATVGGLVGLSRLVLGVHWPTDVVAGWVLGTAVAVLVVTTSALLVRLDRRHDPARGRPGRWESLVRMAARTRA
jgi:undecaprenyl-diphosphatase